MNAKLQKNMQLSQSLGINFHAGIKKIYRPRLATLSRRVARSADYLRIAVVAAGISTDDALPSTQTS